MKYKYEITDDLVLLVWDTENPNEENKPFLRQPYNPDNGQGWTSETEAIQWINRLIEAWSQPPAEEPAEE